MEQHPSELYPATREAPAAEAQGRGNAVLLYSGFGLLSVLALILTGVLTHWRWTDILLVAIVACLAGAALAQHLRARRAEAGLAASESNMLLVADSAPQVLWQGLQDGRVTFLNLRWTEITGASVDEGIADDGWAWQNWFHPDDREGLLNDWAAARASGSPFDSYRRLLHVDGTYRWLQITARPIRSAEGEIVRWYGVSTDIHSEMQAQLSVRALNQTLEQRVEERARDLAVSERRYRSIFEQSQVGMIEQDLTWMLGELREAHAVHGEGLGAWLEDHPDEARRLRRLAVCVDVNPAVTRLLRNSRELMLSEAHPDLMDAAPRKEFLLAALDNQLDGWERLIHFHAGDGTPLAALCSISSLESEGGRNRIMLALVDVTDREHTREQLLGAHDELARANRALSMGALSMSLAHDLGQPITAMVIDAGTGERLLQREPADIEGAGKALKRIGANAQRAGDLLSRTREQLVRRSRSVEPIDLRAVVQECLELTEREIRSHRGRIDVVDLAPPLPVEADGVELRQVLINLLMNAIQATAESGANDRTITLTLQPSAAGFVEVAVRDRGPGLPEGGEQRVFDPLFSTKPGSMGMGLAICRHIVESFGGSLVARNNDGPGATFSFTLPLAHDFKVG